MIERIGIVGGGQLGRMLTEAALPLGFDVTVLDANENCPAAQVGAHQLRGEITDGAAITELACQSDVTTWEIEHIDTRALEVLALKGQNIQPEPTTLAMIKDKYNQHLFLEDRGIPVARSVSLGRGLERGEIASDVNLTNASALFGGQLIIKSRYGGYDGRGNLKYNGESAEELEDILGRDLYAEQIVDFSKELAVIAVRDTAGRAAIFPTVETVHEDNICHTVTMPADIDPRLDAAAQEVAHETLRHLGGAGVFAIEMFALDDSVFVNEIAPRVHNSGHLTIEANETSQFEQHIRAITGMPLGSTTMRAPAAVMVNILGTRDEPLSRAGLEKVLALPDTHPHFYGKDPRPARKIGHITVLGADREEALATARQAREALAV
jgi:5-(carboxyamino)imidazole ribonucleotide synthase